MLFTLFFLILFCPLCYLLYDYILSYEVPLAPAKQSLSEVHISPISINRSFTNIDNPTTEVTVLMYHLIIPEKQLQKEHIDVDGELVDTVVTLENFTKQMDFLKKNNYTTLTLNEFEDFMTNGKKVPEKSVLITFDDGYKNVFTFAYPILKKHNFYAVQFIITGLITDRTVDYNSSLLQYASIGELKKASDVFDYGNHTNNFHQRRDDGTAYLEYYNVYRVSNDIRTANEWIGNTTAFAAPYGEYNPTTLTILKELGITMAFTIEPGYASPLQHILEIPRLGVYPDYTIEDFKYIVEKKAK